jgi:hypothetical protein
MRIDCTNRRCRRGRIKEYGFDGWDDRGPCPDCQGEGSIELTPEEAAILREFDAGVAAALDGADAVADVLVFLNAPGHCPRCQGTGRVKQAGFDGWDWVPCWDCTGLVA